MPSKVTLIGTYSPSGSSDLLDITSIPGTYTDLFVKYKLACTTGTPTGFITVNNSGGGYNYISMFFTGSGNVTNYGNNDSTRLYMQYLTNSTTGVFTGNLYIQNYAAAYKKMIQDDTCSTTGLQMIPMIHYWDSTATISSIKFDTGGGGNWRSSGTVSVYGISKS